MIGILIPGGQAPSHPPEQLPISAAALSAQLEVCFIVEPLGEGRRAWRPVPGGWVQDVTAVAAVYDRYPSQSQPDQYRAIVASLGAGPVCNPPDFTALLRDKLRTQDRLDGIVPVPEVCADPALFDERLEQWSMAFHKPRYGSFGRGVTRVCHGDELTTDAPGGVRGTLEPAILQRAILPPAPYAGVSIRVLVQRVQGTWCARAPVARVSTEDPVVNAARGAGIVPVVDLFGKAVCSQVIEVALSTAMCLAEAHAVEMGVDIVLDPNHRPWVIEVNARPRGRLKALADQWPERFMEAHRQAVAAPLHEVTRLGGLGG